MPNINEPLDLSLVIVPDDFNMDLSVEKCYDELNGIDAQVENDFNAFYIRHDN